MGGCLLSSFLLFNKFVYEVFDSNLCICFMSVLISFFSILSISKFLIGCLRIAPLTHVVTVMRRLTCQPTVLSARMSVFSGSFVVGDVWKFVVVVGELY